MHLIAENCIMIHSAVIRRQCLNDVALFDPKLRRGEDWDFWVRVAEKHRAIALDAPVGVVRVAEYASGQLTGDRRAMHVETLTLQQRWLDRPRMRTLPNEARGRLLRQFKATSAWVLASSAIDEAKRGSIRASAYYFAGAFGISSWSATKRLLLAVTTLPAHALRRRTER